MKDRKYVSKKYIHPAIEEGFVEMTMPDARHILSRLIGKQKNRLKCKCLRKPRSLR